MIIIYSVDDVEEKNVSNKYIHNIKESGITYKPKDEMTGGDLLIKGKPSPYAYI